MIIDDQAVISAERSVEAVTWLRNLITKQVSAEEAARQTANLQPTATAVQTIEAIRKVVEEREVQEQERNKALETISDRYDSLRKKWEEAGADVLRDVLDPDALSETDNLADICTALKLDPERALSRVEQMTTLSRLAEEYLAVDDRHTQREYALGIAQQAVRDAVEELQNAVGVLNRVTKDVEEQAREKETLTERERVLQQDINKQNQEMQAAQDKVERTGLRPELTHSKIAKRGERLREVENKLEVVKLELEKYHGLPAVSEAETILSQGI
ncbi:Girdin [Gracilaria domingensis]|nr:Girdin [Gracilaria domingensis]